MNLERTSEAEEMLNSFSKKKLTSARENSQFALTLQRCGRHAESVHYYRQAIEMEPNNANHCYNLATAYRFAGQTEQAERSLEQVIEINPKDADAYYLRAGLRTQTEESNHIPELYSALRSFNGKIRSQMKVHYALAKELEDIGKHTESFANLKQGSDIRRANMHYSLESDLSTLSKIKTVFNHACFEKPVESFACDKPIFILGMPRTGSTLVERIISSHSAVDSAGELTNFALEMTRIVTNGCKGKKLTRDELVELSANLDFKELGQAYINSTGFVTGNSERFIDKLPLNYLYIGLIHLALPNARIIHIRRDPMDACYAIYKTLFESAYPFSYALEELGRYYLSYRNLMEHWDSVIPGKIFHIDYEELVAAPEQQSRKLLNYCGLNWEEKCLSFYKNPKPSTTASASQVRNPIYSSSIGRWQNYEHELRTLFELFNDEK